MNSANLGVLLTLVVVGFGVSGCAPEATGDELYRRDRATASAEDDGANEIADDVVGDGTTSGDGRTSFAGGGGNRCSSITDRVVVGYQLAFDRLPDTAGYDYYFQQIRGGMAPLSMFEHLIASPEFTSVNEARSDAEFTRHVFKTFLGRLPDSFEIGRWLHALHLEGTPRGQMALSLARSAEFADPDKNPSYTCFF